MPKGYRPTKGPEQPGEPPKSGTGVTRDRCSGCGAALEAVTPVNTYEARPPMVDAPEERKVPGITRTECPNGCPPSRPKVPGGSGLRYDPIIAVQRPKEPEPGDPCPSCSATLVEPCVCVGCGWPLAPERPITLGDIADGEDPLGGAPFFFVEQRNNRLGKLTEEIKSVSARLDANKSREVKPPERCSRCGGPIEMKNGCGFCPACVADGYVVGVFSFRMPGEADEEEA